MILDIILFISGVAGIVFALFLIFAGVQEPGAKNKHVAPRRRKRRYQDREKPHGLRWTGSMKKRRKDKYFWDE